MAILEEISTLLQAGRAPKVKAAAQQALDEGVAPKEILRTAFWLAWASSVKSFATARFLYRKFWLLPCNE